MTKPKIISFSVYCHCVYSPNPNATTNTILHIWLGCILGIIIFSSDKKIEFIMTQEVANVLLVTSAVLTWCWNLLERMLHFVKHVYERFKGVSSNKTC
jgi:hypothetical protein